MTGDKFPAGIDVTRPSVARVYDYWLGGKDHFASDRQMGERMAEVNTALPQLVRHNREFICAAAARAATAGANPQVRAVIYVPAGRNRAGSGRPSQELTRARRQRLGAHSRSASPAATRPR
jgi:hypothetical protein